ncbi:MAG: TlyA family RNA methyltransferase [Myxococcota bacterium]|nr:TlyA family RNA methyltransferase [Myxococcota bacterium]
MKAGRVSGPGAQRKGHTRLDERLVVEGLAESRSQAQALILSGVVLVDDVPVDKAGAGVADAAQIRLRGGLRRFVSRGGEKLLGALEDLALDPAGLDCLDVGASTGGFTDCLLQAGAHRVLALDVGRGQLHSRLRMDERVVVLEGCNARNLEPGQLEFPVDLVVADVSFISLALLMPGLVRSAPGAEWLLMVKPQFEVGREQVGKGGVVRDDGLREAAVVSVIEAAEAHGYRCVGRAESRLAGPRGNREIFARFEAAGPEGSE